MNKSAAGHSAAKTWIWPLIVTFAMVKLVLLFIPGDLVRHLGVAGVLIAVPLAHGGRANLGFFVPGLLRRPERLLGSYFCLIYAVLPYALLMFFLPNELPQARLELRNWVLSVPGISAILIAPVAEEFYFRGWLLNTQLKSAAGAASQQSSKLTFGAMAWICYSNALLFWILHIPVQPGAFDVWVEALKNGMVPVSPGPFLLGLVTCALTLMTGTPRSALIFHMLANALGPMWWPLLRDQTLRSFFYY